MQFFTKYHPLLIMILIMLGLVLVVVSNLIPTGPGGMQPYCPGGCTPTPLPWWQFWGH